MITRQWLSGADGGHNDLATWSRNSRNQWFITVGHGAFMSMYIGVTDDYGIIQPVQRY